MNLVTNAVTASEKNGKFIVTTGQERSCDIDDDLHGSRDEGGLFHFIEVADEGCGIPSDEAKHVFEPFYTDSPFGGGLELAVVYGIVNSHNGLIRLGSTVGKGASFRVMLPAALSGVADDNDCKEPKHNESLADKPEKESGSSKILPCS